MSITSRHIDVALDMDAVVALRDAVAKKWPDYEVYLENREVTLVVPAAQVAVVLAGLKEAKGLHFSQLMDVCGVDYLGFETPMPARFAVVYHLLSLVHNTRIRVKAYVADGQRVPTVTSVFVGAGWYEREAFDMFGIIFEGHPDLRRILTDYGFEGYPLRKDFPLTGHVEMFYDSKAQEVAYKPVDLPQEFRNFDDVSPWKGATGNAKLAEEDNAVFSMEAFK